MAGIQSKICLSYPISCSTTPGVRPADDFQMTYVIRQWNLTQNLTLMSSACHLHVIPMLSACRLHVICTRLQLPKYFQLNSRTALLNTRIRVSTLKPCYISPLPPYGSLTQEKHTILGQTSCCLSANSITSNWVLPQIDDSGNIGNKGSCREEQNNISKKVTSSEDWTWDLGLLLWHILFYTLMPSSLS